MSSSDLIKSIIRKHHMLVFYGMLLLLNFIQVANTELLDDEAYYWVYSRFPTWGYFDHPPMISFFIGAGYFFIKNELGVRLLVLVGNAITLFVMQRMLYQKNDRLFYMICLSIAIIQIGGIIAAPDNPLMLFTALFFLVYKNFLRQMTLIRSILLGFVIACMFYSKYHSVLVILFTLASNPKLFRKYQTYLVAVIAIACYAPHIYWQFEDDFVSIRFQLLDRFADNHYKVTYTVEYLLGQILLAGPLAGIVLIWAAFAYRGKNLFDKALKYNMIGFYVFFLLSTLRGRMEVNWTIVALIPIIVLSHQYLTENENSNLSKWLYRLAPVTFIAVLLLRIYLITNVSSLPDSKAAEVRNNRSWALAIQAKADGLPVIFLNSYQNASKYWFYSKQPSFSLNTLGYRRNNYNLWQLEDSLFNRRLLLLGNYDRDFFKDSLITNKGIYGVMIIPEYSSFSRINIMTPNSIQCVNARVNQLELLISVYKPSYPLLELSALKNVPLQLWVSDKDQMQRVFETGIHINNLKDVESKYRVSFPVDLPAGKYIARFSIPSAVVGHPTINSLITELDVLVDPR